MKIVGSIATIPSRINNLKPTLVSLHTQTLSLDKLYVVIPQWCKKEQSGYTIPNFLHQYCQLIILDQDYGSLNKLIGPLQAEHTPETIIITFDDDIVYPNDLVQYLDKKTIERPNAAIGTAGIRIGSFPSYLSYVTNYDDAQRRWFNFDPVDNGSKVDILIGYAGNLYKRGYFPPASKLEQLTRHALEDDNIYKNDDVLISSWLSKQRVDRYVYPGPEVLRRDISYHRGLSNDIYSFAQRAYKAIKSCEKRGLLCERVPVKWCWTVTGPIFLLIMLLLVVLILARLILREMAVFVSSDHQ
uniref:Glycosyltransferase n=1 Tax=Marseillevirus LCMAC201 TaxID=2506605 RepID=A0A481YVV8_9VIRU|nr:MAG: glycosyltransferase [Marseillevirus LCMAC201]